MNYKKLFLLFVLAMPLFSMGQSLNVLYSFRTYHTTNGNYAEINTSVDANSAVLTLGDKGMYSQKLELTTIICKINNPDSAVYVDKRIIKSPEVADSNMLRNTSILDMQRMYLDNGDYVVYFELRDLNTTNQPMQYRDALKINYDDKNIDVSDIMLIEKYSKTTKSNIYSKGGYDLQPYMFDVISKDNNILNYYVEIYNADKTFPKDSYYALVTTIEDLSSNKKIDSIQTIKRLKASDITSYIGSMDISSLAEASYFLTIEVRNGDNILYAYKRYPFFKQSDKKIDYNNVDIPQDAFVYLIPDSNLTKNMYYILPIASESQKTFILKNAETATPVQKRYFLYQVFKERNAYNPNRAWQEYISLVDYVNNRYKTPIKEGYETDMGRVYLVYGAPSDVIDEKFAASSGFQKRTTIDKNLNPYSPDIDANGVHYYPYQIWIYNTTPFGEANRKFVFYARQNNLIEYTLLHSNAKGEIQDPAWERTLSRNSLEEGVEGKAGKQFRVGHE
ncbi:MAG: GWxTD domain-containing protein [Bacteroidales bacterium]|nr:GWxTD domain-containing protein [Bacteroidales bacterium]